MKALIPYLLAIAMAAPQQGAQPGNDETRLYNQAQQLLQKGDAEGALRIYRELMSKLPPERRASMLNNQAWIDLHSESTRAQAEQEALRKLKKALTLDPGNETARYNLELLLRNQQNQPPPPSPTPPPPPDKEEEEEIQIPQETNARRTTFEPQSDADVEHYLKLIAERKYQYFHQAPKSTRDSENTGTGQKPW